MPRSNCLTTTAFPYKHTLTDAAGAYPLPEFRPGRSLSAVKEGYLLSDAAGVTLSDSATVQMNLACTADATLSLGAIAGTLTAKDLSGVSVPLAGAKITLQTGPDTVVATTYTAADGEFAFTMWRTGCIR